MSAGASLVSALSDLHWHGAVNDAGLMFGDFVVANHLPISDKRAIMVCSTVTGMCDGIWGTLAVGLFYRDGFGSSLLMTQATDSAWMCLAAFVAAIVVFKFIDLKIGLRANDDDQEGGLDFVVHPAIGYPDFLNTYCD